MHIYGQVIYTPIREIGVGQGRNSVVVLAEDPHLGREIAVKEIDRTNISGTAWNDYYREAQAMFAARHNHVVPIHYACHTPTHICLAMPYYSSGSLADRIVDGPLPLKDAYRIADGILGALAQVHAAGLIHFDVKPSNILFSAQQQPLIADFGQARFVDALGTADAPRMYRSTIPPEIWTGGVGTVESDVYQGGLTLYRTFNGNPYYEFQLARLKDPLEIAVPAGRLPNRRHFLPHVPAGIRRVIRRALKVDSGERYASASEFQDALGRVEVPIDWTVEHRPAGEITWTANRTGRPSLEVRLLREPSGRWRVEAYSKKDHAYRRKRPCHLWAAGLRRAPADQHLEAVFTALERE